MVCVGVCGAGFCEAKSSVAVLFLKVVGDIVGRGLVSVACHCEGKWIVTLVIWKELHVVIQDDLDVDSSSAIYMPTYWLYTKIYQDVCRMDKHHQEVGKPYEVTVLERLTVPT